MDISSLYTGLPIEDVLAPLRAQLAARHEVVLQAPPGAGKTTLVPLALLGEAWLGEGKILVLQPRRLAAKTAAHRLASLLGESVSETVGYRMRQDTRVGPNTRIEIVTEGVLTRMLQQDPGLEDVGLVIFDEFHERSLDLDLGLSLCLAGRELFREGMPLKLLLMSASLNGEAIADWLGQAPVVTSQGRQFPVTVNYRPARNPRTPLVEQLERCIIEALDGHADSSLLVFLPGQGEIHRLASALQARVSSDVELCPLYGNLSIDAQHRAIAPVSTPGRRKVVLATNIAETSLTIDGVDIVIDAGLMRQPIFDPGTGLSRLATVRISQASSLQRMGRAGRLRPGHCYRLWSEAQQSQLAAATEPEILSADLAPLALQLLRWGVSHPAELSWLDAPPQSAWQQGLTLLEQLGAVNWSAPDVPLLSRQGELLAALPMHPRLAHLLVSGARVNGTKTASQLAAILSERDPFSQDQPDITHRLAMLEERARCPAHQIGWRQRTLQLAQQFAAALPAKLTLKAAAAPNLEQLPGYLLACAYPDRIARRRHAGGFQLANGRGANFAAPHYLGKSRWLAVAEVSGIHGGRGARGDVVRLATALDPELFEGLLAHQVKEQDWVDWDKSAGRFVAERRRQIGALVLSRQTLTSVSPTARCDALIALIEREGLDLLAWSKPLRQWQARVMLVRQTLASADWPDVSNAGLAASLRDWLAPYLMEVSSLAALKRLDLDSILQGLLSWPQRQQLDELAPQRISVPSGSAIEIDYGASPPVLAVKLQEMFGCETTPRLVNGQVAVLVHLLSPAGRPLQVTQDLAGFWRSSYLQVQKEMKGRYPKHPWPDNPLIAPATRYTKRR